MYIIRHGSIQPLPSCPIPILACAMCDDIRVSHLFVLFPIWPSSSQAFKNQTRHQNTHKYDAPHKEKLPQHSPRPFHIHKTLTHPFPSSLLIPFMRPKMPLFIEMRHIIPMSPSHLSRSHPPFSCIRVYILPKIRFLGTRRTILLRRGAFLTMCAPSSTSIETRRRTAELRSASAET